MIDPADIPNWLRLDARLTSSGQPTRLQLAAIAALGVRHVINLALATHERALPDEGGDVAALGMTYTHIPVPFEAPTEAHFTAFCAAMAATGQAPVHVHCIVNARASAFLYRYRRDILGEEEAAARAMLARIWRPGGAWARFIGNDVAIDQPHRFAD